MLVNHGGEIDFSGFSTLLPSKIKKIKQQNQNKINSKYGEMKFIF